MKHHELQFVVVIYNKLLKDSESIQSLLPTILGYDCGLLIYDNSNTCQDVSHLTKNSNIKYIHDETNSGLSKAYNISAKIAKEDQRKYMILLDQDTIFPSNSIDKYLEAINKHDDKKLFAPILKIQNGKIMSPCIYRYKWGKLIDFMLPGKYSLHHYLPVNSGLCISIEAFFEVGGYNEKVKLDGADFQFIERFKKKYDDFIVLDLVLFQNFSLFDNDFITIAQRYKMFIEDVSNFERSSLVDRFWFQRIIVIRTILLTLQTKKSFFIRQYINKFFNPFK